MCFFTFSEKYRLALGPSGGVSIFIKVFFGSEERIIAVLLIAVVVIAAQSYGGRGRWGLCWC